MEDLITALSQVAPGHIKTYLAILRVLVPIMAGLLLFLCGRPLLTFRREPEIWAWLILPDGKKLPITHWENVVGRSKRCDIVVDFPTVSRNHAVLTRYYGGPDGKLGHVFHCDMRLAQAARCNEEECSFFRRFL